MFCNLSKTFIGVMSMFPKYSAVIILRLTFVYKSPGLQFTAFQGKKKRGKSSILHLNTFSIFSLKFHSSLKSEMTFLMYIYVKLFDASHTFAVVYLHTLTCANIFFPLAIVVTQKKIPFYS